MQIFAYIFEAMMITNVRSPQFGAILFRCAELIGDQGSAAVREVGIDFNGRHTSIVLALNRLGPSSSGEIADHIGLSRQLIESRLKAMLATKQLRSFACETDGRKKLYDFNENWRETAARICHHMGDFEAVYTDLWNEIGVDIEQAVLVLERILKTKSLSARLQEFSLVSIP